VRLIGTSQAVASLNIVLRQGSLTIGSAPGNAVVIPQAAARHARLRRQSQEWLIEDLGSCQATFLNGIRVIGRQALRPGDIVTIGPEQMAVRAEPHEEEQPEPKVANRRAWLGASSFMFVALAALVAVMARMPDSLAPLALADATRLANAETATATGEPQALTAPSATSSPTSTTTATATRTPVPTLTATATARATPSGYLATLQAALAGIQSDRAAAAIATVAGMSAGEQQAAVATAAAAGEAVGEWVDSLVGTPTPVPPLGRLVFGRYLPDAGRYDVVVHDLASGAEYTLLPQASQPAFSPDGSTIAFRSWQTDALGVYAATADGSQRWLLTREAHPEDGNPAWSPDSALVAFASLRYGDGRSRIYVVPAAGGIATGICIGEYVDWSPDGTLIAFKGCIGGSCGIMLAQPDCSAQQLVISDASDGAPAWSPDGQLIAFDSSRDGSWDIYVMRPDGSELRRLTTAETIETLPVWSPDGRYLAFRSNRNDEWAIWALPAGGGEEARLAAANLRPGDEAIETFGWPP